MLACMRGGVWAKHCTLLFMKQVLPRLRRPALPRGLPATCMTCLQLTHAQAHSNVTAIRSQHASEILATGLSVCTMQGCIGNSIWSVLAQCFWRNWCLADRQL